MTIIHFVFSYNQVKVKVKVKVKVVVVYCILYTVCEIFLQFDINVRNSVQWEKKFDDTIVVVLAQTY